jgi:hypothetical protein
LSTAVIATVVLAHELLWSITDALLASGTVDLARSLTAARADEETPVDLLFIQVKQKTSTWARL